MKKLLYVPLDYHLKPNKAWFDAFGRVFDCEYYGDHFMFTPDYVFMQSGAISPDEVLALKKLGATIIQWTGDCREHALPEVLNTPADITLLASALGQHHLYPSSKYLQHAANEFRPVREDTEGIVAIWNHYDQFPGGVERNELAELLDRRFMQDFELFGSVGKNQIPYEQTADRYHSAYIAISHSIYNDIEGYWSNRPLDIMASGCCCLMRYSPNAELWFKHGVDCVMYRSNEEAVELIQWLQDRPMIRNSIARHGQATVKQFHSYDFRVQEIIKYITEYEAAV